MAFILLFLGVKRAFREAEPFFIQPDPLPVLHKNKLVELGHTQAEAATGKSESVPELQQSGAACWVPCWCLGLAPSQGCHANPPQGQACPACVGTNPGRAGVWMWLWCGWRVSDGSHTPSLALHVFCRTMLCLGNCILVSILAPLCLHTLEGAGRGCWWFLPGRKSSGDVMTERGGNLSKSSWPKLTKLRAVCPRLLVFLCGRGLPDWQAGAQPIVELHSLQGERQQSGSRGTERAGVSSSQVPVLPFPVT